MGSDGALPRLKFDCPAFDVNEQLALDDIEKFVVVIVLVSIIFALDNNKTNHRMTMVNRTAKAKRPPLQVITFDRNRL